MKHRLTSAHAKDVEAFIRFEEGLMEYLFSHGHLSAELRPMWEARLFARLVLPVAESHPLHRTAVRDYLEMSRGWPHAQREDADRFLTARSAPTFDEIRRRLDHRRPK